MNLRTYLRLVQPVVSLLFILQCLLPFVIGQQMFYSDRLSYHLCLILVVWLPAILGYWLASAAHELMHQPFILLLPDALGRLRKITIIGVLAFSAVFSGVIALAGSLISPVATFGLAAGFLALPCTSRHRGLVWPFAFFLAWGTLIYFTGAGLLAPAMVAAPAAFLVGGLALAAASIAYGFSRQHLRERTETPFRAPQGIGVAPRNFMRNFQRHGSPGQDWNVQAVSGSNWSWMRAIEHGVSGRRWRGGLFLWLVWVAGPMTVCALFFPTWGRVDGDLSATQYWSSLAHLAAVSKDDNNFLLWTMYPIFSGGVSLVSARPRLAFPLSRDRLARAVFGLTLFQWVAAWFVTSLPIFLVSLLGQFMSGNFLPAFGLPVLAAFAGSAIVLFQVLLISILFVRPLARFHPPTFYAVALISFFSLGSMLSIQRERWLPYALTPLGTAILVFAAVASATLRWRGLRHHYLTGDYAGIQGFF
jgi:hypothetical protein